MALSRASSPIIRSGFPRASTLAADHQRLWAPYYANRQTQLGNTATLVNFGDPNAGAVDAATFTGKKFHASGLSPVWTPSAALSAFTTPLVLSNPANWANDAPILTFNGSSEDITTPDAAYYTTAAASTFSWGFWLNVTTAVDQCVMAKWNETTGAELREWYIVLNPTNQLQHNIYDETVNSTVSRQQDSGLTAGTWYHCVFTYGGATDGSDTVIYVNGAAVASTASGSITTMRDTATLPRIGSFLSTGGTGTYYLSSKLLGGPFCPFMVQAQLTAAQVANLYAVERLGVGV